ncbi:hypothetical protein L249_2275 [Ophiocordyceps polyrhachis-furcata BCC 54312]|uniref:Uncharacterized protein n=1 Tax=Ophiocordyceps polyrhachis-furcata BCC 54312 TaxID=1330021 RepID=A0A367LQ44_9HYPO|nr:hypothetical protein L249_2275 [Ophiocordyceps polyrhachis-furcata BCC 54312]
MYVYRIHTQPAVESPPPHATEQDHALLSSYISATDTALFILLSTVPYQPPNPRHVLNVEEEEERRKTLLGGVEEKSVLISRGTTKKKRTKKNDLYQLTKEEEEKKMREKKKFPPVGYQKGIECVGRLDVAAPKYGLPREEKK